MLDAFYHAVRGGRTMMDTLVMRLISLVSGSFTVAISSIISINLASATETDTLNINVTANRKTQAINDTLAPVTVITQRDIARYQATDINDILRQIPNLTIKNDGGMGKLTGLSLRGSNSNQVLVLVDGVRMNSLTAGSARLEHIPVESIERIEIVRGVRSSLYGSDAIGGVIQIFTQKAKKGFHTDLSLSAGSHNTLKTHANINTANDTSSLHIGIGKDKTDGINACNSTTSGCYTLEPDKDGYDRNSLNIRANHRLTDKTQAELSVLHSNANNDYDGSTNRTRVTEQIISGKLKHSVTENDLLSLQISQATDKAKNYQALDGTLSGQYDTRRNTLNAQWDKQFTEHASATIGIEHAKDKITQTDQSYAKNQRNNDALFANYQHTLNHTQLDISARQDKNQQFGRHATGSIALGHHFNNGLHTHASYGSAFKAPTFDDTYYPASAWYQPNPNLKPESAKAIELGIKGSLPQERGTWGVTAFNNRINNLITYTSDPITWVGTMENVNRTRIRGIELEATTQLNNWQISGNATLQKPENRTDAQTGNTLQYRPTRLANLDIDRKFGKTSVGTSVHAENKRYTDAQNTQKLAGFTTVDLRADYALNKHWKLGAKIGNVFDKQYQTNAGYNQDGRNTLFTVKYTPN